MYVITGATGNTGKPAAERLLAQGKKVRVIGRSADRLQSLVAQGAEPFLAEITDAAALAQAFTGAEGVYAMIPPDLASQDFHAQQNRVSDALVQSLNQAGVKHVVSLSSVGADKTEKTGPVVGLHEFEEKLNQIAGLNVVHLRAGYFMSNTLAQAGAIHAFGKCAGPVKAQVKLPLIAPSDIGVAAADLLLRKNFSGKQTRELLGQRDLDYNEITTIMGKTINQPELQYVRLPDEQIRPGLMQLGMSGNVADLLLALSAALNSGHIRALEHRSAQNTTPTTFESFVTQEFVPLYQGKTKAA
ncbi:MAG TPA: NmrA family NAD(P)-binding protein [Candidatus Angelobacter sp.]